MTIGRISRAVYTYRRGLLLDDDRSLSEAARQIGLSAGVVLRAGSLRTES